MIEKQLENLRPFRYDQTCLSVPDINAESVLLCGSSICLRSYCTTRWECSLRRACRVSWDRRRLSYFMILLFLRPDPWFVTSLLASYTYVFFVLLLLETFLLWIFSPDSCYLPSKIFCNQINIECKLNEEITKISLYFIQYRQRIR